MNGHGAARPPGEREPGIANEPPVDPRKPSPDPRPASRSTGGRKDHELPGEGEGPERAPKPQRR